MRYHHAVRTCSFKWAWKAWDGGVQAKLGPCAKHWLRMEDLHGYLLSLHSQTFAWGQGKGHCRVSLTFSMAGYWRILSIT